MKKIFTALTALVFCMALVACGGETAFTLQRSTLQQDTAQFTNAATGLTLTMPEAYYYYTEDYMAQSYFGKTVDEMNSMTQEDYARMDFVPDYVVLDEYNRVEVRFLNLNILMRGYENPTEDTYLEVLKEEKISRGTSEDVFEKTTVTLGGRQYSVLCMNFSTEKQDYVLVNKISDDYMTCIIVQTENATNLNYFVDMFNGGVKKTAVENVPQRSDVDKSNHIFTNGTTGVVFKVPVGWNYSYDEDVAEKFYSTTADVLHGITVRQWTEISDMVDFYALDETDSVQVVFKNTRQIPAAYGMAETEYLDAYIRAKTADGWYCDTENSTVSLSGVDFTVSTLWKFRGESLTENHFAVKKLNEDYMCIVNMSTTAGRTVEDFRRYFSRTRNNTGSPDSEIKLSKYYGNSHSRYNPVADLTVKIPAGWQLRDYDYIAENYYNSEITGEDLRTFSAESLGEWQTVYDFEAYNEETGDTMLVFHENINYNTTGIVKKTFDDYMSELTDDVTGTAGVTLNDSFTMEFETKRFHCIDMDVQLSDGQHNVYMIITQTNEDYATVMYADTLTESTIDDFLFLIYEGNTAE